MANPQNLKVPTSAQARENGAKGGSSPKRKQTLDAKRIMNKLLTAKPVMSDSVKASLENLGIDTNDDEIRTTAALMSVMILKKALSGDMDAIKMALEMAGQSVTAKDITDRERIKLEREKFEFEKKSEAGDEPVLASADDMIIRIREAAVGGEDGAQGDNGGICATEKETP